MYSRHILVTSSDGVPFVVHTTGRTLSQLGAAISAEEANAAKYDAATLDAHLDYGRASSGIDAYQFGAPVEARPERARPVLRLIQGGKP